MKWVAQGHELDKIAKQILWNCKSRDKFYIYGAGNLGKQLLETLRRNGHFSGFSDNDVSKQINGFCDESVIKFEDYKDMGNHNIIIIAASEKNTIEIKKELDNEGFLANKDYYTYEEFLNQIYPIIAMYCHDELFMSLCQIVLTERCSLKCKKCAHACYATDYQTEDMTLEQVANSANNFFKRVDYIHEFVLIGGEPLLYKDLSKAIEYIGGKYRRQMGTFSITTNGTIMPDMDIIKACRKYNVLLRISNYSAQIPRLKEKYKKLTEILEENEVRYDLTSETGYWMDYGFEYVDNGVEPEKLMSVFDTCKTPCREIRGNRLYYCVMARSVSDNLHMNVGKDDYLDFEDINNENYKKQILEYTFGYSEKGYLDMCRYCHGTDAHKYVIPVAEQMNV